MPILTKETDLYPADLLERDELEQDGEHRWWAIYTRSRREKDLMRQLKRMGLAFYGPTVKRTHRSPSGRLRTAYLPLFTNYVFLHGDARTRHRAFETNCVSSCLEVADSGELTRELRRLRHLIETDSPVTLEQRLDRGALVRVKSGPLRGLEGLVITRRGSRRLVVSVSFLQQGASVEIDDFLVEPA